MLRSGPPAVWRPCAAQGAVGHRLRRCGCCRSACLGLPIATPSVVMLVSCVTRSPVMSFAFRSGRRTVHCCCGLAEPATASSRAAGSSCRVGQRRRPTLDRLAISRAATVNSRTIKPM